LLVQLGSNGVVKRSSFLCVKLSLCETGHELSCFVFQDLFSRTFPFKIVTNFTGNGKF
jgi:hypothetical protein